MVVDVGLMVVDVGGESNPTMLGRDESIITFC